jgi:excisionase family DNA binding protein
MAGRSIPERMLTAAEVGALFGVAPRTITKWARLGKFPALVTLGGHRRFDPDDVRGYLDAARTGPAPKQRRKPRKDNR